MLDDGFPDHPLDPLLDDPQGHSEHSGAVSRQGQG
jgi:hypothetical protein